jgi:hypothetical protein
MPDYQNAKIYKIYCYENDEVYYGSTVQSLSMRMACHRSNYKRFKEGKINLYTSIKILQYESAKIVLVENFPCNSKEELLQREQYFIKNNCCVNKYIPLRTYKEHYNDNIDKIKAYQKEYHKKKRQQKKEQQLMLNEDSNINK